MSRSKKSIEELREECDKAAKLYRDYQSPYLEQKAREAKRKLDNALKANLKKNFEPVVKQISLL